MAVPRDSRQFDCCLTTTQVALNDDVLNDAELPTFGRFFYSDEIFETLKHEVRGTWHPDLQHRYNRASKRVLLSVGGEDALSYFIPGIDSAKPAAGSKRSKRRYSRWHGTMTSPRTVEQTSPPPPSLQQAPGPPPRP